MKNVEHFKSNSTAYKGFLEGTAQPPTGYLPILLWMTRLGLQVRLEFGLITSGFS